MTAVQNMPARKRRNLFAAVSKLWVQLKCKLSNEPWKHAWLAVIDFNSSTSLKCFLFCGLQEIWLRLRKISADNWNHFSRTNYFFIWRSIFYFFSHAPLFRLRKQNGNSTKSAKQNYWHEFFFASTWTFNACYSSTLSGNIKLLWHASSAKNT